MIRAVRYPPHTFDELEVGACFECGPRVVSREDIAAFAKLSGDQTALHTDEALRGLVLLSGSFVAGDWWRPRMNRLTGQNVFQSHGTQDTVLAISGAEALRDGLEGGGAQVQWHSFRGGHEIPMDVIEALRGYLPPGEPQSGQ